MLDTLHESRGLRLPRLFTIAVVVLVTAAAWFVFRDWRVDSKEAAIRKAMFDPDSLPMGRMKSVEHWQAQGAVAVPRMIEALAHESPKVRAAAALALARIGAEAKSATPELIQRLEDDDANVRETAAYALEHVSADGTEFVSALIATLDDEIDKVRRSAAHALDAAGDTAIPELIEAVRSANPEIRRESMSILTRIGRDRDDAVAAVRESCLAEDPLVRQSAYETLSAWEKLRFGDLMQGYADNHDPIAAIVVRESFKPNEQEAVHVVPRLREMLEKRQAVRSVLERLSEIGRPAAEAVPEVREIARTGERGSDALALDVLPRITDDRPGHFVFLKELILSEDFTIAWQAAERLGKLNGDEARSLVPQLMKRIEQGDLETQEHAALTLSYLGAASEDFVEPIAALLQKHKEWRIRLGLVIVLGNAGPKAASAVPLLIDDLNQSKNKGHTVEALGKIGPAAADALPAIIRILKEKVPDESMWTHTRAIRAVGRIGRGDHSAYEVVQSFTQHDNGIFRAVAYESLIDVDQAQAFDRIRDGLKDPNRGVRAIVCLALVKIPDAAESGEVVDALIAALTDRDPLVRTAAVRSLGELGTPEKSKPALRTAMKDPQNALKTKDAMPPDYVPGEQFLPAQLYDNLDRTVREEIEKLLKAG